jgi:hypothetical protein
MMHRKQHFNARSGGGMKATRVRHDQNIQNDKDKNTHPIPSDPAL